MFGKKNSDKQRAEQKRRWLDKELTGMEYPGKEEGPAPASQSTLVAWLR